jgi:hypothetical protein
MANTKRTSYKGCIGWGVILFLGSIALISGINHKREEAKKPVISATFETISGLELGAEDLVSINGHLDSRLNDGCNYPNARRCQVDLIAADPKSTDIRVILLVAMASEGMQKRNTVLISDTGEVIVYTDDKQRLTSNDLIVITGHIINNTDSYVSFYVDKIEAAP